MDALVHDLRYAARTFLRAPGFAAVAMVTLALGIGANIAIFSLVHTILFKPLAYRDPSRLIVAWDSYLPQDKLLPIFPKIGVAPPELDLWRQQHDVFEETAWYRYVPYELSLTAPSAEALSIRGGFGSTNILRMLGIAPALGRIVVHTAGNPKALIGPVRAAIQSADPDVPVSEMRTMDDAVAESAAPRRWTMSLLASFAGLAMVLALVGIYGVISWSVTQRTREIGVRAALGASAEEVVREVLGRGIKLSAAGLAIGLLAAFSLRRVLASQIFGVSPSDPSVYAAAAALMFAVSLAACYLPARRASRVDPLIALRWE
jgi:hypothetical protein